VKLLGQLQSGTNNYNFASWNHQLFKLDGTANYQVSAVRLKDNFNSGANPIIKNTLIKMCSIQLLATIFFLLFIS
jgi:hypothetical protein